MQYTGIKISNINITIHVNQRSGKRGTAVTACTKRQITKRQITKRQIIFPHIYLAISKGAVMYEYVFIVHVAVC